MSNPCWGAIHMGDFKKNEANATILIKENIKGFLNT